MPRRNPEFRIAPEPSRISRMRKGKNGPLAYRKDTEEEIRQQLKEDFPHYAYKCLRIRTKKGDVSSFKLNKAQLYIHEQIEDQLKRTGKVRALILKGRQQGCSTYVEGRFYWKTSHRFGVRTFILTHLDEATQNLYQMAKRFHQYCPDVVRPSTSHSNAKELKFNILDSGYRIGTAKSEGTGRSDTIQYFHGSEVAFWPKAETHLAGALQAVPDMEDTEVILESTANGMGNIFYEKATEAMRGESEYILIFVPWFWQKEYQQPAPKDMRLDREEVDLKKKYKLNNAQIAWRRKKIRELGSVEMFKQEYPCNPQEAFAYSGLEAAIPAHLVEMARRQPALREKTGPKVLGIDVATKEGPDPCSFAYRQGREVHWVTEDNDMGPIGAAVEAEDLCKELDLDAIIIDKTGVGYGTLEYLLERQSKGKIPPHVQIIGVNSSDGAYRDKEYTNRRSEMIGNLKKWLEDTPNKIPDDDGLCAEIITPAWDKDGRGRYKVEDKREVKKRLKRSCNKLDAVALTTAEDVESFSNWGKGTAKVKPSLGGVA